jgi:molybdopterin synthase catalytic subunit
VRVNNGRMSAIRSVEVTDRPLDLDAMHRLVSDDRVGAIVSFSGNVRNHDHGRAVASLRYEGHPSAADVLREVADDIASRFEIITLAVAHRIGPLAIGDAALVAAVGTAHRGEAYRACEALVDLTKERLPVWKHQIFDDGTDEWVNCA